MLTLTNQNLSITLSGTDNDGSITSFSITEQPANGTLTGTPPNLSYISESDFGGNDQFQFAVTDNDGAVSDPATVNITVVKEVKVSVVDVSGFDDDQHGGRIVQTFWQYTDTEVDTNSLVKISRNSLDEIFARADSEITKEIGGAKIIGINARAFVHHVEVVGDYGIFWTASDSFSLTTDQVFFDDQHNRYFSYDSEAVARWISDRNVLYISSIENTTLGELKNPEDPADKSKDPLYCDDFDTAYLCGELDDYIAHTRVGIENTIFVGAVAKHFPSNLVGIGAIRGDGVYADNTIYAYADSTSHAVAVVAAMATNIAEELKSQLGRVPTPSEIKDALLEEAVETEIDYEAGLTYEGSFLLETRNIKIIGEVPSVFPGS